ncbi:diaminopimelate dehydrogenase [Christensenellaceae bacterium OttesenSCG-928-K19]|nr:diaminopimelate dehydrogenase [Christensenellaceae bacterium OttesenSCG-928-K19]
MIKTAVFGYGNVGKAVVEAVLCAGDFELVAVVDNALAGQQAAGQTIKSNEEGLPPVDVAILAVPSRLAPGLAESLLQKGIYTVDGYDIHGNIPEVWEKLGKVAKENNAAAILSAGWDPGTDSVIRTLFEAMAPRGITYTNFGPGMSMGHSVAAKAAPGVADALSLTIPTGAGVHRRMVYIQMEEGADFEAAAKSIKADDYFAHDETHVQQVEDVRALMDMGHGTQIERKGASGNTQNQLFSFEMRIDNPALTAQVLVCAARAVLRQQSGCYTLIEIPPVDFLPGPRADAVRRLV